MKTIIKTILTVTLLTSFVLCKAGYIYVDTVYAYSEYYNSDSSHLYLVSGLGFTNYCTLDNASVISYSENELTFRVCYGLYPPTVAPYRTDTFDLGVLPNRPINIRAIFSATYNTLSPCADTANSNANDTAYIAYSVTGIKEIENSSFSLSPNPVASKLTLQLSNSNNKYFCQIISPDGRVLMQNISVNSSNTEIDISNLPAGLYFAVIQNAPLSFGEGSGVRSVRRFVKE